MRGGESIAAAESVPESARTSARTPARTSAHVQDAPRARRNSSPPAKSACLARCVLSLSRTAHGLKAHPGASSWLYMCQQEPTNGTSSFTLSLPDDCWREPRQDVALGADADPPGRACLHSFHKRVLSRAHFGAHFAHMSRAHFLPIHHRAFFWIGTSRLEAARLSCEQESWCVGSTKMPQGIMCSLSDWLAVFNKKVEGDTRDGIVRLGNGTSSNATRPLQVSQSPSRAAPRQPLVPRPLRRREAGLQLQVQLREVVRQPQMGLAARLVRLRRRRQRRHGPPLASIAAAAAVLPER